MTQPALSLRNLTKRWSDGSLAFGPLTLSVPAGQLCVILGHSGAGKSTLLRCIAGLETASAGSVHFGQERIDAGGRRNRNHPLAMVHQNHALIARASAETNVLSGAARRLPLWRILLGAYPASERALAAELIERVGIDPSKLGRRAGTFSGGEQQRIGLARAFMAKPRVIMADEPTASLDAENRADMMELLKSAARTDGLSILCALHEVELAHRFADRVLVLQRGQLVHDGPPDSLWERPGQRTAMPDLRACACQMLPRALANA